MAVTVDIAILIYISVSDIVGKGFMRKYGLLDACIFPPTNKIIFVWVLKN